MPDLYSQSSNNFHAAWTNTTMARIRKVAIANFRGIRNLEWTPSAGINCLLGPGDAGKSTIIEAIDLCLGARRTIQFSDADFYNLDVTTPISVTLTLGDLEDRLKSLENYALYLRGYDAASGAVEDEPGSGLETVLCLNLQVGDDLEPTWTLLSERAQAQNISRNLSWGDRVLLAPTRIGALAHLNFGWRKGSVLNRLTGEQADASGALAQAARDARSAFGSAAETQLSETLRLVGAAATDLGIDVGDKVRALLDAHSVTFTGGTISLHNEVGVPLRGLGTGSTRLLIAGLQGKAAAAAAITLVDEVEHGLEPHRIIRFLGSLGAKQPEGPMQVFMTTHSPVVIRELSGDQLVLLRSDDTQHRLIRVGADGSVQGTVRAFPDALLATSVVVCEGASEVGLVRGIDQHAVSHGATSIFANGTALVDCGGGDANRPFERAAVFHRLGYRVAVVRDSDTTPSPDVEARFIAAGGTLISWRANRAIEDELFMSLPVDATKSLLDMAASLHGSELVDSHIQTASSNQLNLAAVRSQLGTAELHSDTRSTLGIAARSKRAGWFKSVSAMEEVGREIVGPALSRSDDGFRQLVSRAFEWMNNRA